MGPASVRVSRGCERGCIRGWRKRGWWERRFAFREKRNLKNLLVLEGCRVRGILAILTIFHGYNCISVIIYSWRGENAAVAVLVISTEFKDIIFRSLDSGVDGTRRSTGVRGWGRKQGKRFWCSGAEALVHLANPQKDYFSCMYAREARDLRELQRKIGEMMMMMMREKAERSRERRSKVKARQGYSASNKRGLVIYWENY